MSMAMSRNSILLAFITGLLLVLGVQRAASNGYLSAFDASPPDLHLSVHAETNGVTVEWQLGGGKIVRSIAGGRDAVILIYPAWVEDGDSWRFIADIGNASITLDEKKVENPGIIYYSYRRVVSNGSARIPLRIFRIPFDFPSTVGSGRIRLEFESYKTCNNATVAVIYFHSTGRGEYRDLVLPLSVSIGRGFPVAPGFSANINFTVPREGMLDFLLSAVNAYNFNDIASNPRGWLVVKTVNVTVCPPKTS